MPTDLARVSLWEWGAYVAGWNADNADPDAPPTLSDADIASLDALMDRIP